LGHLATNDERKKIEYERSCLYLVPGCRVLGVYLSFPIGLPDPFAVVTVDGDQTHTTTVMKKTLNPYWNESFEV
jgi:E3 ubiquitin-protein ligase NEDD4